MFFLYLFVSIVFMVGILTLFVLIVGGADGTGRIHYLLQTMANATAPKPVPEYIQELRKRTEITQEKHATTIYNSIKDSINKSIEDGKSCFYFADDLDCNIRKKVISKLKNDGLDARRYSQPIDEYISREYLYVSW